MELVSCPLIIFLLIAVGASVFYGMNACQIFGVTSEGKSWSWKIHQFWLNFAGSIFGWAGFWFLGRKIYPYLVSGASLEITVSDILLFFLVFIGTTGFLPMTIVGLVSSIKDLVAKLVGLLK